jgi:N-acetyl-1-D-myo-inositol-2-amino-2-deoxy-alpha-D-glucopyranoside deacetylase
VAATRITELEHAADLLGVDRLVRLGRRDSGVVGDPGNGHRRALARAHVHRLARQLADVAVAESAEAVFYYDRKGIYGHPDHVAVHHIGATAAAHVGITGYEITVDHEYLNLVDRHIVEGDRPRYGRPDVGAPSAEITTAIRGTENEIASKRLAMAAHASQIPSETMRESSFDDVYGLEWYIRRGPAGALEALGNDHVLV